MRIGTKHALIVLFLAALFFTIVNAIPAKDIAIDLVSEIRAVGAIAPVVYFFVFLIAAVIGFSRTALIIIAGIVFDPVVAFLTVVVSLMAAFTCTFILSRYLAADWVAARLEKIPVARSLMSAVERHGFRLLVLMRLNPFVPGIVNGYGFGMTSMKPFEYFAASLVGSLPLTLIYIYLGWAGGEAMLYAGTGAGGLRSGTLVIGVVLSALMLIAICWYGRRAIVVAERDTVPSTETPTKYDGAGSTADQ